MLIVQRTPHERLLSNGAKLSASIITIHITKYLSIRVGGDKYAFL